MPVTDDLRAISERAEREIDAVHDRFEHLFGFLHRILVHNPWQFSERQPQRSPG